MSTDKDKTTYRVMMEMNIHDTLQPATNNLTQIMRVPGGWIYTIAIENGTGGFDMASQFVPICPFDSI